MPEELKFPMFFKCPRCGSDKRILNTLAQREIAEGILKPDDIVCVTRNQITLAASDELQSGKHAGKKLRQLWRYWDNCAKCGTQYMFLAKIEEFTMPEKDQKSRLVIYKASEGDLPPFPGPGSMDGRRN